MHLFTPRRRFRWPHPRPGLAGFTLVELLVVIAIISVLAALLLPSLTAAKGRATAISCLNNQRQLGLACDIYADEFNDRLPYNLGEAQIRQMEAQNLFLNWSTPIMDWEPAPDNTNQVLLTEGGIGPYTSRAAALYRCPNDRAVSDLQSALGWNGRARSVSLNAMMGDAGLFSSTGSNTNNPSYRQFFKLTQVPQPAMIFAFIEEHANSISDGYFLDRADHWEWYRLPAAYHNGGANLSFADGHSEGHKWLEATTRAPIRPGQAYFPISNNNGPDFQWLMARTSVPGGYGGGGGWTYP
jgi:prepilin-type N-terminal cleavage/methylation domain-containing protein/prepilin-type processing-associated H-X9-DG protein